MHKTLSLLMPKAGEEKQSGINMVDLMMWLVIAALLLAAAIQGIGYYQQNANIYQMKEAVGVAKSRIMAIAANDGSIDAGDIDSIVAEENTASSGDQITLSVGTIATTAAGESSSGFDLASATTGITTGSDDARYIRATHSGVPKYEVIYLFKDIASKKEGTHLVNSGTTDSATPAGGTPSPSASAPTPEASPTPTFSAPANTFSTLNVTAQNGSPTANHGNGNYQDIASTSDGTTLIATSNVGYVFKSTDSGVTWNRITGLHSAAWKGAAMSGDGKHMTVGEWDRTLWVSNDYGVTWTSKMGWGQWWDISMSRDGKHQVAGVENIQSYYSHDYGATWTTASNGTAYWKRWAVSDDGQTIVGAASLTNQIFISKDGGVTWGKTAPVFANAYRGVSISADGQTILAAQGGANGRGGLAVSRDAGATWTMASGVVDGYYHATAMSADGTKMAALGEIDGKTLYTSVDAGVTWKATTVNLASWFSIATSDDGAKLAFVSNNGQKIHTAVWE